MCRCPPTTVPAFSQSLDFPGEVWVFTGRFLAIVVHCVVRLRAALLTVPLGTSQSRRANSAGKTRFFSSRTERRELHRPSRFHAYNLLRSSESLLLNRVEQSLNKARAVVRVRHGRHLLEHGEGDLSEGVCDRIEGVGDTFEVSQPGIKGCT